jgi:hypothetical protein
MQYVLISHTISQTGLHSSPAPHFKTFHVFTIYFLKYPSCSIIQCCASNALHSVNHKSHISWPETEPEPRRRETGVGVSYNNILTTRWWSILLGASWPLETSPHSARIPDDMSRLKPKIAWWCVNPLNLTLNKSSADHLGCSKSRPTCTAQNTHTVYTSVVQYEWGAVGPDSAVS